MSDQAPEAKSTEASVSPEVADYFQVEVKSQATEPSQEKVKTDGQKADADKTKENASESEKGQDKTEESDESKSTEEKKTDDTKKEEGEDKGKTDAQPTEFEVAGTKYDTFDKAVKAVNRINGDNTRMSGELKDFRSKTSDLESKIAETEKLLSDYKKTNEDWQKYYEEGGDKPDNTKLNIEEAIDKKLEERDKARDQNKVKEQYTKELDEIFADPEFEKVKPIFQELVDEYDGVPKATPKKLFERAKKLAKEEKFKDFDSIEKMAEEMAEKKLAQKEAAKGKSNTGGSAKSDNEPKLSPEVDDYFKNR